MDPVAARRPRDAEATRAALLHAGMRFFTQHGYGATTVRQIADEAGVNVALINRYFTSKEGLFEACLVEAGAVLENAAAEVAPDEAGSADDDGVTARIAAAISRQATGTRAADEPHSLLLLLRSSGDDDAERLRLAMLAGYAEKLAGAAGWTRGDDDAVLLRAQVLLATAVGIAVLRAAEGFAPLAQATHAQLRPVMRDTVEALLG
ncbi:TetR/AcrR family transcriptional regulator [Demequina maris]|uniref:TetR/AcrR family transcriptional regulator n=1 Tax=Demequina maris TaxID=1638982 RepID=UPI001E292D97|nr:TetR/AcrR family transcriptional regulator [Demequina maris]